MDEEQIDNTVTPATVGADVQVEETISGGLQTKDPAEELTDTEQILDSIKELTKHIGELTKVVNTMKESHDKWVRAGKF